MEKNTSDRPILSIEKLRKRFGGVVAINDVTFSVPKGKIKAVIGPNGAGKTTLFNLITGFSTIDEGIITFCDRQISYLKPHVICSMGICRTFQNIRVFEKMSVLENILVGVQCRAEGGFLSCGLMMPWQKRKEKEWSKIAAEVEKSFGIREEDEGRAAAQLSLGEKKILEIVRAVSTKPKLLMLDEPLAGLGSGEIEKLSSLILKMRSDGITILLVEHNVDFVNRIADEVVVLDYGRKIAEGSPAEIRSNEAVIKAYLGEEAE